VPVDRRFRSVRLANTFWPTDSSSSILLRAAPVVAEFTSVNTPIWMTPSNATRNTTIFDRRVVQPLRVTLRLAAASSRAPPQQCRARPTRDVGGIHLTDDRIESHKASLSRSQLLELRTLTQRARGWS